ncbi:MAG: AlwI family type II restriction endonuclease, partial [Bacteroidota bacterium]|nr:AlwI family type II restriction endonuclease [Bacteroidota bacterium]
LLLLTDERKYLVEQLNKLKIYSDPQANIESLKDLLEETEQKLISTAINETKVSLKNYKEWDDVMNVFEMISNKEVPDPSLYLEWNVWRSLVMINYAKDIVGNFSIDLDGVPLGTALGNLPDIEAEYEGFKMIVEVTLSSGNKQYEMEGEPVARHFGKTQNACDVPVYCLFVAPKISEGALAHFFNLNRFKTKAYGGKTRIVPMSVTQFIYFISIAKEQGFKDPARLKAYLDRLIDLNHKPEDEIVWLDGINTSIPSWAS